MKHRTAFPAGRSIWHAIRSRVLRKRYGRSIDRGFKPTATTGTVVATRGSAQVTHEPDGLYYSWDKGNWYFGFKSKRKAMAHMKVLAGLSR